MASIIKRNGRYSVVVDVGRGSDGRRIRRWHSGFKSKTAAKRAATRLQNALDTGSYVEPSRVTLGDYLTREWLPGLEHELRPSTVSLYRTNIRAYVVAELGHVALARLTRDDLKKFYAKMRTSGRRRGGGLSERSVRILHDAVESGYVVRNVAGIGKPPRAKTREAPCWTPAQLATFLGSTDDDRLSALWTLVAHTGLRRGEVLGLRWSDIDLDRSGLTIRQTLIVVDGKPTFSEPKTDAGRRVLALDAGTVAALRSHRARQNGERLEWGPAWHDSGLSFVAEDGHPIKPDRLSKMFTARVKRADLPTLTFHSLRHSNLTMLLREGVPLPVVAQRAGHSSANVTSAIYSHVVPGDDERAAEAGARLLDGFS
jgi:integrase